MWGIPASPNGLVNYTVVVQEIDLLTREITLIEMLTVGEENLILMYRVQPYSMYNVSVTSLTVIGEGDVVMESFTTDEAGEDDVTFDALLYTYSAPLNCSNNYQIVHCEEKGSGTLKHFLLVLHSIQTHTNNHVTAHKPISKQL